MKKLASFLLLSAFTLIAMGCPPDGAKKDDHDHKPGDGHDDHKDEKKKK